MSATRKQAQAGAANLAAYKAQHPGDANFKHGLYRWLDNNSASPEVQAELDKLESGLVADLGGDPSMIQKTLIATAKRALGVVLLGWQWIESNGVCDEHGDPNPVLGVLASHMNSLRLNLCALGLQRKQKRVDDLQAIIQEHSR